MGKGVVAAPFLLGSFTLTMALRISTLLRCQVNFFLSHVRYAEQEQYEHGLATPVSAVAVSFVLTIRSIACGKLLAPTRNRHCGTARHLRAKDFRMILCGRSADNTLYCQVTAVQKRRKDMF